MAAARTRELRILNEIAQALNRSVDESSALERTLALVSRYMGFRTGWVWLQESDTQRFYLAASINLPPYLQEPVRMTGSICWCLRSFLDGDFKTENIDAIECSRLAPAVKKRQTKMTSGIAYHASVVLRSGERELGILNLAASGFRKIGGDDLRLLSTIGYQVGIAVDRARLVERERDIARLRERAGLARDLHDTFAQDLTAITLQLETALKLLRGANARARVPVQRALDVARENVARARESVERLRFGSLQGRSLQTAISEQAHAFTSQSGVPVHVDFPPLILDATVESELFAIVLEALTNVLRHAKAQHVWIEAVPTSQTLTLRIRDDGVGYQPSKGGKNFGVTGMRERARELNASFSLRKSLPKGTILTVKVPRR